MRIDWKCVPFVVVVLCLLIAAPVAWAEQSVRRTVSSSLADIDPAGVIVQEAPVNVRRPAKNQASDGRAVVFSEDFQGETMPAGWVVIDNDGNTVDPNVSQFTEAWIVAGDFDNLTDFVAMSTSWYSPAGTADDWMITPDIVIGANHTLSWQAEAQDPNFPDGYNVYVSTTDQTIAGCQANPTLFSIAAESGGAWTDHTVSLADYSGETVNICFQNNSTDQFVLMIDDVVVDSIPTYDAAVTAVDQASEYGRVPLYLPYSMALGGTVENLGSMAVTNVVLTAQVFFDGGVVYTASNLPIASLAAGASQAVDLLEFDPSNLGVFTVEYTVTIDETDLNPANDTALAPFDFLVTADQLGRDDNVLTGTLGVGDGTAGELGAHFTAENSAFLEAATFQVGPFTPPVDPGDSDIVGDHIYVNLREMVGGAPGAILATTEVHTFIDYDLHLLTLNFSPPVALPAGDFMLGVVEEDDNIALGHSDNILTLGTGWVDFVGSPFGTWANSEDFGFFVAFFLRAVLSVPVLTVTTDGTATGTVDLTPPGVDCGTGCTVLFNPNAEVTLVPTPDAGAEFAGWSGDADCSDGQVTMTGDINCNGTFNIISYNTLTVAKTGNGTGTVTSSPAGINCGVDCSEVYQNGTVVDLTATPDGSWLFMGWRGDVDCFDGQVTMSSDLSCTAVFDLPLFADGFESGGVTLWSSSVP